MSIHLLIEEGYVVWIVVEYGRDFNQNIHDLGWSGSINATKLFIDDKAIKCYCSILAEVIQSHPHILAQQVSGVRP